MKVRWPFQVAVLLVAAAFGVPRYLDYRQRQSGRIKQMQAANEELFNKLAHDYMRDMLLQCAKRGLGLQCKQDVLF